MCANFRLQLVRPPKMWSICEELMQVMCAGHAQGPIPRKRWWKRPIVSWYPMVPVRAALEQLLRHVASTGKQRSLRWATVPGAQGASCERTVCPHHHFGPKNEQTQTLPAIRPAMRERKKSSGAKKTLNPTSTFLYP